MKKPDEKQRFSSLDVALVAGSLVALVAISLPIISRQADVRRAELARDEVRNITEVILTSEYKTVLQAIQVAPDSTQRQIASAEKSEFNPNEGTTGRDPWGNPYKYRVIRNSYGQPSMLAVWSVGPNSRNETLDQSLRVTLENYQVETSKLFGGDDIGSIKSVK